MYTRQHTNTFVQKTHAHLSTPESIPTYVHKTPHKLMYTIHHTHFSTKKQHTAFIRITPGYRRKWNFYYDTPQKYFGKTVTPLLQYMVSKKHSVAPLL